MANNFLPLSRQIQMHWIWKDREPFDKRSAWVDLLMLANYETKKTIYKKEVIECKRGDVNMSILQLAERWRWSRQKTRNFLYTLESDKMITINATTHRTTITIVNYGFFNDKQPTNKTTNFTTGHTTRSQQEDITNNINKINNISDMFLRGAYEAFCNNVKKVYPKFRFDEECAFDNWLERISKSDNLFVACNNIGYAIYNYAEDMVKNGNQDKVMKLSNALGKGFLEATGKYINADYSRIQQED